LVNFAAESHVDNSITANQIFFESNVRGVYNLLELIRAKDESDRPLFVQISTDEVYGTWRTGCASETDCLRPSSPYAATKAAADQLITAWNNTYGVNYILCRSCNNYGYGQYPEKLFAKTVDHIARDRKMTIHGDGSYTREWLYARENCEAILMAMEHNVSNEIYNISSNEEWSVLDVARMIIETMKPGSNWKDWVEFVPNRWGQDRRYAVDASKIRSIGWEPKMLLKEYIPEFLRLYEASPRH
jgi:dTDP-glucose 4,6-dehydratase